MEISAKFAPEQKMTPSRKALKQQQLGDDTKK